jgi:hypothetical protein
MRHIIRGEAWGPYVSAIVLSLFLGLLASSILAPKGAELVWFLSISAGAFVIGSLAWTIIWWREFRE